MKLAFGVLMSHGFPVPADWVTSFQDVLVHVMTGESNKFLPERLQIQSCKVLRSQGFPPDVARNEIVRSMLSADFQYLLFLDADMRFPADLAARLLQQDKPVVTARYHMRKPPYHACAYVKHRTKDGPHCYAPVHFGQGCFEIERGGAGALLIRRDVLEAIRFRSGDNWFRYQRGPEEPHDYTVSEDFWFFRQAREAGFSCWCDWETECDHLQPMAVNGRWNSEYLKAQMEELPTLSDEKRTAVLDSFVACGFPDGLTLPTGHFVPAYELQPGER